MFIDRSVKHTFGKISDLYDKARNGYPNVLIDEAVQFAELHDGDRVLDIGCGSGQVMVPLAQKGLAVTGIDISPEFIELATKKCVAFPQVTFLTGSFEDFSFQPGSFRAIVSGMAWHWVAPEHRYEKAAELLQPHGALAFFWSYQDKRSPLVHDMRAVLERYGGPECGPTGLRTRYIAEDVRDELLHEPLFIDATLREYQETIPFDRQRYMDLVCSYGWAQALPEEKRATLLQELSDVLERFVEPMSVPFIYVAVLARKR